MNALIYVVNYHADHHLLGFVESVRAAVTRFPAAQVQLHVHDNSEKSAVEQAQLLDALGREQDWIHTHFSPRNNGYFGGLSRAQSLVESAADCVIFCNPDVRLAPDFFEVVVTSLADGRGVLAPSILSEQDGFDQNPKYVERLAQGKLTRLRRIYSNGLTFAAFQGLARLKELLSRSKAPPRRPAMRIYAPHGSVLVFTDARFFKSLPAYPCFLFGEELFIAEEARLHGVPVSYEPRLRVNDTRHASIRLLSGSFRRKRMLESVRFILETYYQGQESRPR